MDKLFPNFAGVIQSMLNLQKTYISDREEILIQHHCTKEAQDMFSMNILCADQPSHAQNVKCVMGVISKSLCKANLQNFVDCVKQMQKLKDDDLEEAKLHCARNDIEFADCMRPLIDDIMFALMDEPQDLVSKLDQA